MLNALLVPDCGICQAGLGCATAADDPQISVAHRADTFLALYVHHRLAGGCLHRHYWRALEGGAATASLELHADKLCADVESLLPRVTHSPSAHTL